MSGFLESNREELEQNDWLIVGYIPVDMNTSVGITRAMSSANIRNLLTRNNPRIVAECKKKEIMRRMPEAKRYIVCHETIHGRKYLDIDMRRKTRAGRSSHWQMVLGCKPFLNSNKLHSRDGSETAFPTTKPTRIPQKN